jgi:hypothetical protein
MTSYWPTVLLLLDVREVTVNATAAAPARAAFCRGPTVTERAMSARAHGRRRSTWQPCRQRFTRGRGFSALPISASAAFAPGRADFGSAASTLAILMPPAALLGGLREHLAERLPEPQRLITDGQHRSGHLALAATTQQISPRLHRLTEPVGLPAPCGHQAIRLCACLIAGV